MINKPLPHSIETEQRLLASVLQDPSRLIKAQRLIKSETFYDKKNRDIWDLIIQMKEEGKNPNNVTLTMRVSESQEHMDKIGLDTVVNIMGMEYLFDINDLTEKLHEKYTRRVAAKEAYKILAAVYDQTSPLSTAVSSFKENINNCMSVAQSNTKTANELILEAAREISDNLGKYKEVTGIPSGYEAFDMRTSGFPMEGDLCIVGARPGMGKTTIALNMANNAVKLFGRSGAFFSLEMKNKKLIRKIISSETGISVDRLKRNKISEMEAEHLFTIANLPNKDNAKLYINDTPNASIHYIISEAHRMKREYDIQFLYIDYLQLISSPAAATRELQVAAIAASLKQLASDLDIPVIALCQLNRANSQRGGSMRPKLTDLRESGSLEQDASMVMFIHRPEYYGITEDDEGRCLKGITELVTAKWRDGEPGADYLYFDAATSKFLSYDVQSGNKISPEEYNMRLVEFQTYDENETNFFTEKLEDDGEANWRIS